VQNLQLEYRTCRHCIITYLSVYLQADSSLKDIFVPICTLVYLLLHESFCKQNAYVYILKTRIKMIHVRVDKPHTDPVGKTLEILEADLMKVDYTNYDTIIINNGHEIEFERLERFANLFVNSDINLFVSGNSCTQISNLKNIADVYED
jgi:hypothetical protein